jgi:hypothetical protein
MPQPTVALFGFSIVGISGLMPAVRLGGYAIEALSDEKIKQIVSLFAEVKLR